MFGKYQKLLILLLMAFLLSACQPSTVQSPVESPAELISVEEKPCKGPADKERMCTMHYQPVCGCDNKTYSNQCVATGKGILRMTEGACGDSDQL